MLQQISPLLRGAVLLLLLSQLGCSVLLPDSDLRVRLVNRTDRPLIYSAMTSDVAMLIYMPYTFPVGPDPQVNVSLLQPGASVTLTREAVMGEYEPSKAVTFFLYEVNGDTAVLKDMFFMTRKDLEHRHFRLEITQLPMTTTP